MAVAKSPLVKTAFFGQDPNWGRIFCAVGYSGSQVDEKKTSLRLGGITVAANGVAASPDPEALQRVMTAKEILVEIDLNVGLRRGHGLDL